MNKNTEKALILDQRYRKLIQEQFQQTGLVLSLDTALKNLNSDCIEQQHRGTVDLRRLFSTSTPSSIDSSTRLIRRLVELSRKEQYPQLVFQTTWALVNMTAQHYWYTYDQRWQIFMTRFMELARHENLAIVRMAIRGFVNKIYNYIDNTAHLEYVDILTGLLKVKNDTSVTEIGIQILSIICKRRQDISNETLFILYATMQKSFGSSICLTWLETICQNCDTQTKIQLVFDSGAIGHIFYFLEWGNQDHQLYCLVIITKTLRFKEFLDELIGFNLLTHLERLVRLNHNLCHIATMLQVISNNKNGLVMKYFLTSTSFIRSLLDIEQRSGCSYAIENNCEFFCELISYGDPEELFLLYSRSNLMRTYSRAVRRRQYIMHQREFLKLIEMLQLCEKFKASGKNKFAQKLIEEGAVERLEKTLLSRYQAQVNLVCLVLQRFIDC